MKTFILGLLFSLPAMAIDLTFVGPCSEEFIMKTKVTEEFNHVGDLTVATLNKFSIPFKGYPEGIAEVLGLGNYTETISAKEFRTYGWCYRVDGVVPEVFPYETYITPETEAITWFYGYSHYKNGQWLSQCTDAYKVKPKELCDKAEPPGQTIKIQLYFPLADKCFKG